MVETKRSGGEGARRRETDGKNNKQEIVICTQRRVRFDFYMHAIISLELRDLAARGDFRPSSPRRSELLRRKRPSSAQKYNLRYNGPTKNSTK